MNEFLNSIKLFQRTETPVYIQLAEQISYLIKTGTIPAGSLLPGTRVLADTTGIHRKTALQTMEELRQQGWITVKPGVGTFVSQNLPEIFTETSENPHLLTPVPPEAAFPVYENRYGNDEKPKPLECIATDDGKTDGREIDHLLIARHYSHALRKSASLTASRTPNKFVTGQIARYLNEAQQSTLETDNIVTFPNENEALRLLCNTVLRQGDTILVASPGNDIFHAIIQQEGLKLKTVNTKGGPLTVENIRAACRDKSVKAILLTPDNQYPTGHFLPVNKRLELLTFIQNNHIILLEHYHPMTESGNLHSRSIFSFDQKGHTILFGSLTAILCPIISTGYIAAPANVVRALARTRSIWQPASVFLEEKVLAHMIADGDLAKLTRKLLKINTARTRYFTDTLSQILGPAVTFTVPRPGNFSVCLIFSIRIALKELALFMEAKGCCIPDRCLFQNRYFTAIKIGTASMNSREALAFIQCMKEGMDILGNH